MPIIQYPKISRGAKDQQGGLMPPQPPLPPPLNSALSIVQYNIIKCSQYNNNIITIALVNSLDTTHTHTHAICMIMTIPEYRECLHCINLSLIYTHTMHMYMYYMYIVYGTCTSCVVHVQRVIHGQIW